MVVTGGTPVELTDFGFESGSNGTTVAVGTSGGSSQWSVSRINGASTTIPNWTRTNSATALLKGSLSAQVAPFTIAAADTATDTLMVSRMQIKWLL